jgi:hypothetical protein
LPFPATFAAGLTGNFVSTKLPKITLYPNGELTICTRAGKPKLASLSPSPLKSDSESSFGSVSRLTNHRKNDRTAYCYDSPSKPEVVFNAFRDQIVHIIAFLDTPTFASPAVMERWARQFMACTNYYQEKEIENNCYECRLTPAQQLLNDVWDEHVRDEFATKDAAAALETMVPDAYVNHVPVLTGGVGVIS